MITAVTLGLHLWWMGLNNACRGESRTFSSTIWCPSTGYLASHTGHTASHCTHSAQSLTRCRVNGVSELNYCQTTSIIFPRLMSLVIFGEMFSRRITRRGISVRAYMHSTFSRKCNRCPNQLSIIVCIKYQSIYIDICKWQYNVQEVFEFTVAQRHSGINHSLGCLKTWALKANWRPQMTHDNSFYVTLHWTEHPLWKIPTVSWLK